MSWIQNHILLELTRHATRRYSQLKPRDVEGNLFIYHLKGLLKDDFVTKSDGQYTLSIKGQQYVSMLSLTLGRLRKQPQIVTTVVCQNAAGEYLFIRWHRQPNPGLVSFPHGMMHWGESIFDAAGRELAEKAGLAADLTYRGDVYIRAWRGETTDRHMLVHVFAAQNAQPTQQSRLRSDNSEPFWASLDTIPRQQFVPGFYELAKLAQKNPTGTIFRDITVAVED